MRRTTGLEASRLSPNGIIDDVEATTAGIRKSLQEVLVGAGVHWSFLTLSGDPTGAVGQLAEKADVSVIVVGTREPGLGNWLEQLLVGSVAVQLTRGQHRPVLVVPLARQNDSGNTTDGRSLNAAGHPTRTAALATAWKAAGPR